MTRIRTRKPAHPGVVFKADVLDPLGLSVTAAAKAMGVSRKHLSLFVNGHASCSKDLALRIAKASGTSVASWLTMQSRYDVWEAEHSDNSRFASVQSLVEVAHV
ncbi:HigA family addiction module antitoxin [Nitrincola nitratireducens]|uniref:Putative HTH-type transcriptional regulator ybaQ n=1 Tax=Nitrincola nitratireducens TaxID=1229521 RepID=W9UUN1_9GAMM|nr:HigA family addiction module antitoxin [Nitrincola nitratireducens]EXJ10943.1 putative HTH-type transcriptional regulator ybaQ [Nitrincola nitratireducens]